MVDIVSHIPSSRSFQNIPPSDRMNVGQEHLRQLITSPADRMRGIQMRFPFDIRQRLNHMLNGPLNLGPFRQFVDSLKARRNQR